MREQGQESPYPFEAKEVKTSQAEYDHLKPSG
jgi:hypothetical protein